MLTAAYVLLIANIATIDALRQQNTHIPACKYTHFKLFCS